MTLTKTLFILTTAGFLSACDEVPLGEGGGGMSPRGASGVDASTIRDSRLAGKLDGATLAGSTVTYSYYTDVISDGDVLTGADGYCGRPGGAVINLQKGERGGRAYHMMAFTCR